MKKILLPTDFSENSRRSLIYAAHLFADEHVEFIIINTFDPPPTPAQVKSKKLAETIQDDSTQDLENDKKFLAGIIKNSGTQISTLSRKGSVSAVLKKISKNQKVDLVIMSPRGKGQSLGFGSNTIAVLKNSSVPVLVVPRDLDFHPYNKVLFAADLQGYSKESLEYPLNFFASEYDAKIQVVHVGERDSEKKIQTMDELVHTLGEHRTEVRYIQNDSVLEGLNEVVKDYKPDLLILVNRHRMFFSQQFLKAMAKNMIIEDVVPMLVLHDKF